MKSNNIAQIVLTASKMCEVNSNYTLQEVINNLTSGAIFRASQLEGVMATELTEKYRIPTALANKIITVVAEVNKEDA